MRNPFDNPTLSKRLAPYLTVGCLSFVIFFSACSGTRKGGASAPAPYGSNNTEASAAVVSPTPTTSGTAAATPIHGDAVNTSTASTAVPVASSSASVASSSATAADNGRCPAGMVLIEGDYCEELEVTCLKKWHAPQNHLWVCEEVKEPTRCVGGSRPLSYCIDRYEFPNRKGQRPMVMQNFYQAQLHCQQRGKRMCTESEWTKACEGPDNKPFPYGYKRDASICHGDEKWDFPNGPLLIARSPTELERLWKGVVSGSQPGCVSDYGVYDMPANADELAASETYGKGPKSDFDNVTTGGPWYRGVRNMCRPKIYSHDESFAYYYLSWRCCQETDGNTTDPRTPKQIKRNQRWERIEWLAHHSWKLPFNPKVPGDEGYKSAGPGR